MNTLQKKTLRAALDFSYDYLLYLPEGYAKDKKFPILFFLHGIGERGSELEKVAVHGPPKLAEGGKKFDFILVCPQCPENTRWDVETRLLMAFIDAVVAEYGADEDRVCVTGLSMGGFGTWSLAAAFPERFAAVAPVCGGAPFMAKFSPGLTRLPLWAFHGDEDDVVPAEESVKAVEALQKAGGNARVTVYKGVGHGSWENAYGEEELYAWLLSKRRAKNT